MSVNNEKKIGYTVNVELFGLPADSFRGQKSHRVKAVPGTGNSFFVNYADSDIGFMFKKIIMPQLALIHLDEATFFYITYFIVQNRDFPKK